MDRDKYPECTIWYVEASDDGGILQSGSAVCLALCNKGKKAREQYLLTCAHVVRARNNDDYYLGKILSRIRVWQPFFAFTPDQAMDAKVIRSPLPLEEIIPHEKKVPASDWVLLHVPDSRFSVAESVECLSDYIQEGQALSLIGYPGGKLGFKQRQIVDPGKKCPDQLLTLQEQLWTYEGNNQQFFGMSGGGLFSGKQLIGIHRHYTDVTGTRSAIRIKHIKEQLQWGGPSKLLFTLACEHNFSSSTPEKKQQTSSGENDTSTASSNPPIYTETKEKAFINYATEDIEQAEELHLNFKIHGISHWLSKEDLISGDKREERIKQEVNAAGWFIPILSEISINKAKNKKGLLWIEIDTALRTFRQATQEKYILPVRIEQCRSTIPEISKLAPTDLFDKKDKQKNIGKLILFLRNHDKVDINWILISCKNITAFYISQYPVTNEEYDNYLDSTNQSPHIVGKKFNDLKQPVIKITWHEAKGYCRWLTKKFQYASPYWWEKDMFICLPSEVQWQCAAQGAYQNKRKYAWGNTPEPEADYANYGKIIGHTSQVDAHPKGRTPEGCFNMSGNVWEWCEDLWQSSSPREGQVIKGGSWRENPSLLTTTARGKCLPVKGVNDIGFRCVIRRPNQK